mgnify:CR=1 FL=1
MARPSLRSGLTAAKHLCLSLLVCSLAYPVLLVERGQASETQIYSLGQFLVSLKTQWKVNQREYARQQMSLHAQANKVRADLCREGDKQYCPPQAIAKKVDIKKLAHAVAVAETSNCTRGTGVSLNNCHGITSCKGGKCSPRPFASTQESFQTFEKLWLEKYGDRFPTINDARRYTATDGEWWLNTVKVAYGR